MLVIILKPIYSLYNRTHVNTIYIINIEYNSFQVLLYSNYLYKL